MNKSIFYSATAIICTSILGFVYHEGVVIKQHSIEQQKQAEIAHTQEKESQAKTAKAQEDLSKQKKECYSYYEKELQKWNNVEDWIYDETDRKCIIVYRGENWKKGDAYSYFMDKYLDGGSKNDGKFFYKEF